MSCLFSINASRGIVTLMLPFNVLIVVVNLEVINLVLCTLDLLSFPEKEMCRKALSELFKQKKFGSAKLFVSNDFSRKVQPAEERTDARSKALERSRDQRIPDISSYYQDQGPIWPCS